MLVALAVDDVVFFFLLLRRPPGSPLFPYTTLFRSATSPTPPDSGRSFSSSRAIWAIPSSRRDRKSTRLNSSHITISYAVFCLKKKNTPTLYAIAEFHSTQMQFAPCQNLAAIVVLSQ